jgi:hypothetical protein
MARKSRNAVVTATAASVIALSSYLICAFAQSTITESKKKVDLTIEHPAASVVPSEPPSCSAQTPCVEDPATGKLYQFDASGKTRIIE